MGMKQEKNKSAHTQKNVHKRYMNKNKRGMRIICFSVSFTGDVWLLFFVFFFCKKKGFFADCAIIERVKEEKTKQ